MRACVDTHYFEQGSRTALVLFEKWAAASAIREIVDERTDSAAGYIPGEFFRRELPCILSVVEPLQKQIETIVIDGYVWLDAQGRKGLGALLYESLNSTINIVGVAKNRFAGSGGTEILRGASQKPLIITAAGLNEVEAAAFIKSMHGQHRMPTLLKRADHLARYGT